MSRPHGPSAIGVYCVEPSANSRCQPVKRNNECPSADRRLGIRQLVWTVSDQVIETATLGYLDQEFLFLECDIDGVLIDHSTDFS